MDSRVAPFDESRILDLLRPVLGDQRQVMLSELNNVLPVDLSTEEMEAVFQVLDSRGVEVVDDSAVAASATPRVRAELVESELEPDALDRDTSEEDEAVASNLRWYRKEIGRIERLTPAQEKSLGRLARGGDPKAIDDLVHANLRLVPAVARRYKRSGMNFLDVIQAGNEGLMEAVRRFDPEKHERFASFATWWIRQAITRAMGSMWHLIRIPKNLGKECHRLMETRARLRHELGRSPTNAETCNALGIGEDHLELLDSLVADPVSLDAPIPGKEGVVVRDYLRDEHAPLPMAESAKSALKRTIQELFDQLTVVERRVVSLRFGLADQAARSLDEVARVTGMSRDEVLRVERRAIGRLRSLSRSVGLERAGGETGDE